MSARYDDAVAELYQAPHAQFVAERKRLAAALKEAGDKAGAAQLAKLPRPPISAWTVNQLWWHARDAFESMLETAGRLREGDLGASGAHRETIAKLRQRASAILSDAGHAATEATLRRVTTTLSAIAAVGWEPDQPGTLGDDRDPPGFEAIGIGMASPIAAAEPARPTEKKHPDKHDKKKDHEAEERRRAEEAAERERREAEAARKRREEETARRRSERHKLEAALRGERADIEAKQREVDRLMKQVTNLQESILQANATIEDIEARIAELADPEDPDDAD